jgi:Flp pilus assembly protein TadD
MQDDSNSFEADQKRSWFWVAGIVAGFLVVAAAGWFGRSYYRHLKEQHEQAQAEAFLASGDYRNALLSARQVIQLDPTNVPVCRVMAALAELSHSPAVLDWQRRVVDAQPTIENKLALASAGLRYENPPFPLATHILDQLAPVATNRASYQVVAANLALNLRRLAEAETHFETAAELDPTNELYRLNLAVIRLEATDETKAAQSRAVLEQLRTNNILGLPALRALVVDRLMHKALAAANDYSTQVVASARAALPDQLQHLEILRQLDGAAFTNRLQWVEKLSTTNGVGAVAQMSGWMQANNLLAEDLRWLTNLPPKFQSQPPIRLSLAKGYLQNADWVKLRDFASKGNWEDMEFLRLALVSCAWSQLGEPQVAESNWAAAVNEAGNRYGAMTTLFDLADHGQLKHQQADLLERIALKFPQEHHAQQMLEQLYLAAGNTAKLQQLYAKLFALAPQDIRVKNNLVATSLLLKTNLPQVCKWAAEIYGAKTNNLSSDVFITSTYAYALHLQGQTQDGLAVMRKLDPRLLQQPDAALYYGVLLAATGATNEAAPFLKIAQSKTEWLPEEKILLSAALGEY